MSRSRRQSADVDALDVGGLRHVVAVLSTVQIVSWGVLYYAFATLQSSIAAGTGWSSVAVTGAFSVSQVVSGAIGIWVGRHIDAAGPRLAMTAASVVAVRASSGWRWPRISPCSTPRGSSSASPWPARSTRPRSRH